MSHISEFLSEQLDIKSREQFETFYGQCQLPDDEGETLYNQMLRGFDPKNSQHMVLASKALENSIEVIVPDAQGDHCHSYHVRTPQQPLNSLEDAYVFLFYGHHAVKLSHHSDNFLWSTHFLTSSHLNKQESDWLRDSRSENALWELFPQWQKDILLYRENLQYNAINSASEELLKKASIKSASEGLKQAFTAPDKFMQGEQGQNLFSFYNTLRLACHPFDDKENPDGTFYISKNVLGAVIFFWQDSASKYIPFIAPDLSISSINDKIQSMDDHLKNYSEGSFLVKKQDIRYVIPALVVLAPVFRKTYTEAERVISGTEDALVYGGLARWQHLSSSVKPTELGKVPVTNDIDLAVEDITSLETISASLEEKLRDALPGTTVRRNNIHTIVLANPKELQRRGLLHTLKINCFPDTNKGKTMGFARCKTKKWRILSIDISAGPEGYFDFMRVEPFAIGSKLLMTNLPALVEKLLQDMQLDQTNPRIDSTRRVQNAQNVLKILLASDTEQQVQAIIQQSVLSSFSESSRLPEFLHPYIKPLPDSEQESSVKAKNPVGEQKGIDQHDRAVSTATYIEGKEAITDDSDLDSHKNKQKRIKTVKPEISDIATAPVKVDIKLEAIPDDQSSAVAHHNKITAPDSAECSKKGNKKTTTQKSVLSIIDFETALTQSIEISNWIREMDHNFPGELNRAIKTPHCQSSEESPAPDAKLDTLQNQLEDGKTKTLQILACSGASADTSSDQPVITINLASTLDSRQRTGLEQAAYENHFPYAQLVQALFILNQKLPSEKAEALKIYEKAFELLLPAAIAGIPLAYQLLIGMQLHNHHPAGWPQVEPVNRLLRSMASRETSLSQIKIEGALNEGFLEQIYQDVDITTLTKIEQELAKESDLSGRGKEVKAILNALREPDTRSKVTALKAIRSRNQELQQTIGSLILILERKKEPAAGQIYSELWSYSLNTLQIKGALKKKSPLIDISYFPHVLAMTDLKAFMDTERTGQLLENNQPRFIAFWKMGFWESYLKASLSKDSKNEKKLFDEHHDKISNKAIEKSRPDLIKDWILARSLLLSRNFIQVKKFPVPASPTSAQLTSGTDTNTEKEKRTINTTRRPTELRPRIRPSTEPFNERVHNQYLFQLDNNIIQEVVLIQENPNFFLQQVEKHITAFRKTLLINGDHATNILGMGYYYFLKALAMMGAKMADDNKTIELSLSPIVKLVAKKIKETILLSKKHYFPYAPMLLLFFEQGVEENSASTLTNANFSAFSGVSQSIEILLEWDSNLSVLAGVFLKWLVLLPKPFELKLAFDADTYAKNPKSKIPGKVTPSIRLLRKFLEQLPVEGSDGAVDAVLNQIGKTFTNARHLSNEQLEQATATEYARAAGLGSIAEADAVTAWKKPKDAILGLEALILEGTAKADAAKTALAKAVQILEKHETENTKEKLRLILYLATGRTELMNFSGMDISVYIISFSIFAFESKSEISILLPGWIFFTGYQSLPPFFWERKKGQTST
ncbi:hypothetical protein [Endozoicomonas sp. SESOKO2]|uniref:hypothetical protein n=1 Tax=Endozoicomonas sp. SESOKO2 TaxID=2828743 RepID=UPI002148D653|nr:hypothetical protein [Endozoicomonas sp. SESOKO2]